MTLTGMRRWPAITFVCAAVFMGAIDFYIVSVAIPDMLRRFPGAGITGISWVINGYTVTFTAALLPAGGLADRYGHRRVFLIGLLIFLLGALGCGVAPSASLLVGARLVQGVGGGTITPLALTLLLPRFAAERRGTAIGVWSAIQSAAVAAGPSVGGALVSAVGWRAVFFLQVPVGLIALGGCAWALRGEPVEPGPAVREPAGRSLPDLAGVGLLAGAIGLVCVGVVESSSWGAVSWRTDVCVVAGVALAVGFVLRSLRHRAPIIDLGLLRTGAVRLASLAMVLSGLVLFALPFGLVLFLIGVWGYTAAGAGLAVTPGPIASTVAALAAGALIRALGPRAVALLGALLLVAGTLTFAIGAHASPAYLTVVLPAILASNVGLGFLVTALSSVIVGAVPPERLGSGTAMSVTARAIGAIVSLSAFALLLASRPGGERTPSAYHLAWIGMSAIAVVLVVVVRAVPGRKPGGRASTRSATSDHSAVS